MQIQRKSNGSAALRIAGRLIFSSPCLLAADGVAALVVSLLFCHASSLDLVNSFPRFFQYALLAKSRKGAEPMEGKKNLCAMISTDLHAKIMAEKEQLELNTLAEYVERIFTEHFEGGRSA